MHAHQLKVQRLQKVRTTLISPEWPHFPDEETEARKQKETHLSRPMT